MAQEIVVNKFLLDIIPIASSAVGEDEIINQFTKAVSSTFGIDRVNLADVKSRQNVQSSLEDYIRSTKKSFVDNALSEYSAFPELIDYKNRGYRSCAIMPLMTDGKVNALLEMLSSSENKFGEEMMRQIAFGASFIGFVLMYKSEVARSLRLATYFDAAFNTPHPQFIVSEGGAIVKANKPAMKSFGVSANEQRNISEILKMDFGKLSALSGGVIANVVMGSDSNGRSRVYAVAASAINDKLLHVMANDITDSYIFNAINELVGQNKDVVVLFINPDYRITNMSGNAEKLFGYSRNVLISGNLVDLISKGEQNDFKTAFQKGLKDSGYLSGSMTISIAGSNNIFAHYYARKFMDGYMIMLVRADAELYTDSIKRNLEDFISGSSDIVLQIDRMGYIRACNLPAETILGFRKDELVGRDIRTLYAEQAVLDRDMNYVNNGGKIDNSFVNMLGKDGVQIPATHSIRLLNLNVADKSMEYIIIVKEFATKRRLSELESDLDKLEAQIKKMKMEGDLKSQFIYNISHELKTPLTNIKGFSRLIYNGDFGQPSEEQKEYLKTIMDEADRLMMVIQQVLDAAKLEADKVKLEVKEVDLRSMGDNPSIKALEEACRNKGLDFDWKVDFDVPEKIQADPNRLIQIFVNLIGNSMKFTEKGSVKIHISLKNKSKKRILCEIKDTGIGIGDADKRGILKKKFYEATKKGLVQQPGAGTGLGLSITKDLVRLHGGKIGFDSKLGEGSDFWFILPASQKTKKREAPAPQPG